jgi:hypothetical protein
MHGSGRSILGWLGLAVFVLGVFVAPIEANAGGKPVVVVPVDAKPYGKTYSQWSDAWWQWAFGNPVPTNPLFDETGEYAAEGQSGNVWFLAGVFNESGAAERFVQIPTGKALFFPILNVVWDNVCPPLDPQPSPNELVGTMQAFANDYIDSIDMLYCELDGVEVPGLFSYRVGPGRAFDMTLPDDNLYQAFGCTWLTPGTYGPFVSGGYYLMMTPLPAGRHTLRFSGHSGFMGSDFTLDITYHITVGDAPSSGGPLLARVMPNPLNPQAKLVFTMSKPGPVDVRIYDLSGRLVRQVLAARRFEAGTHEVTIDGLDQRGLRLPSGILFYRIRAGDESTTGQFVVLK